MSTKTYEQNMCDYPGCNNLQRNKGYTKPNKKGEVKKVYDKFCSQHHGMKYNINGYEYKRYRKNYCENIDGRLGFVCTTTIKDISQLDGDHKDGNPRNNDPKNIQTLCASCHRYKTLKNKDYLTAGRKIKVNKNSNTLDEFMN